RMHRNLLAGGETAVALDETVIYATDKGIRKKRKELEIIRNEKLPAVFDLIGEAAALGDLSENAEFTSAIEERENLNRRAILIKDQLDRVNRIQPDEAKTDHVTLGSRVTLTNLSNQDQEAYSILGPWDGDVDKGIISYLSPMGRALIDKIPGEEFEIELPGGKAHYKLEKIQIHRD
ncbi:MAG: GreA/GreB family elongation factor, partial [Planctomycetota bacterium]